ncbi:MAG: type IV fimbrial biogenesis protein FimT [Flavobacteriaceae bacterium]
MNSMQMTFNKGFTLMELLITISIAGILLALGIPSFMSMMAESRISDQHNSLLGSLYQARSEAIKGASNVTVCPKNVVDGEDCGSDWLNGWIVFRDSALPQSATAAVASRADIISVETAIQGPNTISAFGSTTNVVGQVGTANFVRYLQNGSSSMTTGSLVICDIARGAASSRALNIVQTGDIRRGTVTDGTAPRDVFNRAVPCPDPN